MTEEQRRSMTNTYRLLFNIGKDFKADNVNTWLLIIGLAETYEFVMRWSNEKIQ